MLVTCNDQFLWETLNSKTLLFILRCLVKTTIEPAHVPSMKRKIYKLLNNVNQWHKFYFKIKDRALKSTMLNLLQMGCMRRLVQFVITKSQIVFTKVLTCLRIYLY